MPYSSWSDAPAHVKKRGRKKAEQWVAVWNRVHKDTGDEGRAFAAANSSIASAKSQEVVFAVASDVFREARAAREYEVEYIRSGYWPDFNGQGEMYITNADLADGVEKWDAWSAAAKDAGSWGKRRQPFLDYNHGITNPDLSDKPHIAGGWMKEAWIQDMEGNRLTPEEARKRPDVLSIRAVYDVDDEAHELLRSGKYRLFSPTFIEAGKDEKKGMEWTFEIVGGAMTNIPFFTELGEILPRAASWGPARELLLGSVKFRKDSYISVRVPESGEDLEQKLAKMQEMGFEIESFYQGPRPEMAMAQDAGKGEQEGAVGEGNQGEEKGELNEAGARPAIEWVETRTEPSAKLETV